MFSEDFNSITENAESGTTKSEIKYNENACLEKITRTPQTRNCNSSPMQILNEIQEELLSSTFHANA